MAKKSGTAGLSSFPFPLNIVGTFFQLVNLEGDQPDENHTQNPFDNNEIGWFRFRCWHCIVFYLN